MVLRRNSTVLLGLLFLLCHHCSAEAKQSGGRRRGRCDTSGNLQGQIRALAETQEELRGDMATLQASLATLTSSLTSLSSLVAANLPEDCTAALLRGSWNPVMMVRPPGLPPREVRCDHREEQGGWTVVLSRFPHYTHTPTTRPRPRSSRPHPPSSRMSFNRTWEEYKKGFGDLHGEFWIGNEVLHALTNRTTHELRIELGDWQGNTATAHWDHFSVGSEEDHYRLSVGGYRESSTAKNDLSHHHLTPFSTHDRENDLYDLEHCARKYGAGWWYFRCYTAHLTGEGKGQGHEGQTGIIWLSLTGNRGLKNATMMIRPHLPSRQPCS